jgi:hypothetical protein
MRVILKVALTGLALAMLVGFPAASANAAPQKKCDEETSMQALDHSEPRDWPELYRLFKDYGACDGGALGERFSADVGGLFLDQWEHLATLNRLAANKSFERFVIHHIDTTIDEDDLLNILELSKSHCPAAEKRLCTLIHAKALNTLDDQREGSE